MLGSPELRSLFAREKCKRVFQGRCSSVQQEHCMQ